MRSANAYFFSVLLHGLAVALIFFLGYVVSETAPSAPKVFELVAGAGDNYAATEAPALGSPTGLKLALPAPTPPAEAAPPAAMTPAPAEPATHEEPPPVQVVPAATPAPSKTPVKAPKPLNLTKSLKRTISRVTARLESKYKQRARGDAVGFAHFKGSLLSVVGDVGVDQQRPGIAPRTLRQSKFNQIVIVVDHDQQCCLPPTLPYSRHRRPPIQQHSEAAHVVVTPILLLHLRTIGVDPCQVLDAQFFVVLAGKKEIAAQDGVPVTHARQTPGKGNQFLAFLFQVPVEPADFFILTISVVVAALGATKLIARQHHRRPLRQQQSRQKIAYIGIVRRGLSPAIPGAIV